MTFDDYDDDDKFSEELSFGQYAKADEFVRWVFGGRRSLSDQGWQYLGALTARVAAGKELGTILDLWTSELEAIAGTPEFKLLAGTRWERGVVTLDVAIGGLKFVVGFPDKSESKWPESGGRSARLVKFDSLWVSGYLKYRLQDQHGECFVKEAKSRNRAK